MGDVLVVALDGLDYELIKEFGLGNIKQDEFSKIDNQAGMNSVKTSELFASFITGKTNESHGVKGLKKEKNPIPEMIPDKVVREIKGGNTLKEILKTVFEKQRRYYDRDDLECGTLFEEIDNSRPMYIPSYNPSPFWIEHGTGRDLARLTWEEHEGGYFWDIHEHLRRKKETFRPVNKWYDFLMVHFFRPDMHQHCYGDPELSTFDKDKLESLYNEIDELAGRIIDYFSEDYDTIIFMSDHGLPTREEHNENAFCSCNRELFGSETPHITDFHNIILEKTGDH